MPMLGGVALILLCGLTFTISYLILFHRERRHAARVDKIADALPDQLCLTYFCASIEQFEQMTSEQLLALVAGDAYFQYRIIDEAKRLTACWDAYGRVLDAESDKLLAGNVSALGQKILSQRAERIQTVCFEVSYKNPARRFARVQYAYYDIALMDCIAAINTAAACSYHIYSESEFDGLSAAMLKRHNAIPGGYAILTCPYGVLSEHAQDYRNDAMIGSSEHIWRAAAKQLKRLERRRKRNTASVSLYVRLEPALSWDDIDTTEDSLYAFFYDQSEL